MIPCYSLFLEVEIPDPSLDYFIISQDELNNTEHTLAPPPLGVPTTLAMSTRASENPPERAEDEMFAPEDEGVVLWDDERGYVCFYKHSNGKTLNSYRGDANQVRCQGAMGIVNRSGVRMFVASTSSVVSSFFFDANAKPIGQESRGKNAQDFLRVTDFDGDPNGDYTEAGIIDEHSVKVIWSDEVPTSTDWATAEEKFIYFAYPDPLDPYTVPTQPDQPYAVTERYDPDKPPDPEPEPCNPSGLNTFVLNQSCMDGDVDLLEGWGSAKPDYKWVDLITDTTDISIDRGFDMNQGVVGTPIAGVLQANILDPYLDGIETQKIAVGQRVRLRAGNQVVFSGVASVVRSEYDAVDTPILKIEAVDALGILNAQMVPERPQEGYNTRLAEAASKVDLPINQAVSTTVLNPTEDAMSALDLLVETQDSEGSIVWLDRFGTLYSSNRYWLDSTENLPMRDINMDDVPKFTFTNNVDNPNEEIGIGLVTEKVCLSAYKQVADTSQVINGITFYNYTEEEEEGIDENGDPIIEKVIVRTTHTFESGNSRRLYGDAGVRLTTYLPETDLVGYADYIFANYDTPKTKVETIQFPMDKWKSLDVPEMVTIDIADPVNVRIDDPLTSHVLNRATQRVAQIRHRITPTEWLCELDLL